LRGGHGEGGFWVGGFGGGGGGGGFAQGEAWDTESRGRSWKAADCRVSVMDRVLEVGEFTGSPRIDGRWARCLVWKGGARVLLAVLS
jgi:hypothetical protein